MGVCMVRRIAFIDDEKIVLDSINWVFNDEPYELFLFQNPMEFLRKMEEVEFAVVVADQNMPEMKGITLLQQVRERWPDTVRIIMTGYTDLNIAINAINQGNVYLFISKPWNSDELAVMVKNAVALYELRSENKRLYQITNEQNKQLLQFNQNLETELEARIREIKENEKQRRKLEVLLVRAQKMEAIGTLASGIAHDFNNILFGIMGYTEVASISVDEGSQAKANLNKVLEACDRAKDLISQILSFSKQRDMEQKSIQINPTIKEALKLLKVSLPPNIEIHENIEDNTGIIAADSTKIYQVLMNLCTNAHHAMQEKGGVLEISLVPMDLDADEAENYHGLKPGAYLKLSISDTGHGMDRNTIKRIFDPYFTTKKKSGGTGLGLAVVHGIVKNYNGAITVESEPEKGTTFHVYLPRRDLSKDEA